MEITMATITTTTMATTILTAPIMAVEKWIFHCQHKGWDRWAKKGLKDTEVRPDAPNRPDVQGETGGDRSVSSNRQRRSDYDDKGAEERSSIYTRKRTDVTGLTVATTTALGIANLEENTILLRKWIKQGAGSTIQK